MPRRDARRSRSLLRSTPRPAQVRRAVRRLLADPSYARAGGRIGERIAASPGEDGVVDVVEEVVAARATSRAVR
ncbi:hypothetical protein [Cellulosimicrobium cellulans]|uniref:hypothetical protein n=1 Tax=Cellulosimicrobium cellulans TaxID=1710 RepID=UPI00240772E5|nr:hypothetical protein [Cellulosimicrobium cellulans]MDF9877058.1 UDP:flavonoid glycosyltransferase YjiC (YdhE family) [Cellulosimicrobium cellulans]